jgi:hypothetical protein
MVASSSVDVSETIERVSERLARLEVTVAQGFHECAVRDGELGKRIDALTRKVDSNGDTLHRKIDSVSVSLDRRIDEVNVSLDHKIDGVNVALNRKIEEVNTSLDRKIEVRTDAIREDIRALREEMRLTTDSIRLILVEHSGRLTDLENR